MTWLWVRPCDQAATSVRPGFIMKSQSTEAFERISFPRFARAVRTLKNGALFLSDHVSGSLSLMSGCCLWNTDHWILREMTWSLGTTMLGSTVDFESANSTWLLDELHTFFLRRRGHGFWRFCSMLRFESLHALFAPGVRTLFL